jgi:hypothetical protein
MTTPVVLVTGALTGIGLPPLWLSRAKVPASLFLDDAMTKAGN